jgi:hypothetical protein
MRPPARRRSFQFQSNSQFQTNSHFQTKRVMSVFEAVTELRNGAFIKGWRLGS